MLRVYPAKQYAVTAVFRILVLQDQSGSEERATFAENVSSFFDAYEPKNTREWHSFDSNAPPPTLPKGSAPRYQA
jgi:hypothetical protein